MTEIPASDLARFDVDPERGFLPSSDPLDRLPEPYGPWEELGRDLPKLLASGTVRRAMERLPLLETDCLTSPPELRRAMVLLSYFGHGYVWGGAEPADRIPAALAVPWHRVASALGRPPVLSYASYALDNWRRIDPGGPIALGNIVLLQNFLGGLDEEWFVLVHVDIEAKAAPALRAVVSAQKAAAAAGARDLEEQLGLAAASLEEMYATLERMTEGCDPYVYYHRVRPYLFGWEDQPSLPRGVVYEGVDEYGGEPCKFRGETGAQTGIIPSLDAALGIEHRDDPLRRYLAELRGYMPPRHRAFVEAIEGGPRVRDFVLSARVRHPSLRQVYDVCVDWVARFRSLHLDYATRYIQLQAQKSEANPVGVGTGGTPFVPYLRKHREETLEHRIP